MRSSNRWRLRAWDWVGSLVGLVVVLGVLVAVDDRVAARMSLLVSEGASGQVASWTDRAAALGDVVLIALKDQSIEHAPMLVFTVVGALLVLFMLRT